jgi:hypothetical protein
MPPPSGSRVWLVAAALAVVAVLGVGALAAGWYFFVRDDGGDTTISEGEGGSTLVVPPDDPEDGRDDPESQGPRTAQEALLAEIGTSLVYEESYREPGYVEFWTGPPASEFDWVYVVEQGSDGVWVITDTYPIEGAGDATDAAEAIVADFLQAILEERLDDATLLVSEAYFEYGPANVVYHDGDFKGYTILAVDYGEDDRIWVDVDEEWAWGVEPFSYAVSFAYEDGPLIDEWAAR